MAARRRVVLTPAILAPPATGGAAVETPDDDVTVTKVGGFRTVLGAAVLDDVGDSLSATPDTVAPGDFVHGWRPANGATPSRTLLLPAMRAPGLGTLGGTLVAGLGQVVATGSGAATNTVAAQTLTFTGVPAGGAAYSNIDAGTNATAEWNNITGRAQVVRWRATPTDDPFVVELGNAAGAWTPNDNVTRAMRLWARHSAAGVGGLTPWTVKAAVGGNLWPVNTAIGSLGSISRFDHPAEITSPALTVAAGAAARLELRVTRMHGAESNTPASATTRYYVPGWRFELELLGTA